MNKCKNCGSEEFIESHVLEGYFKCKFCGLHVGKRMERSHNFRLSDLFCQN